MIASIPIPDIDAYHRRPLHRRRTSSSPPPATSSTSGSSSWPSGSSSPRPTAARRRPAAAAASGARLCFHRRRPSSTTSASARPGIAATTSAAIALAVLDSVFGGSTSSRLFREVREKRGLAYSVGSYTEQFIDQGLVATYVGTREDNVEEACEIIGAELARLRTEPVIRRGADAGQGARQGPHGALLGVDRRRGWRGSPGRSCSTRRCYTPRRDARQGRRGRRVDDVAELARRALRAGAALGRLRSAPTRSDSASALGAGQRGPGRRADRPMADRSGSPSPAPPGAWGRPSARRSRPPRAWSWPRKADPALDTPLAEALGGADVVVDFTHPRDRARQRAQAAWRPASTRSSAPPASTSTQLRARRRGRRRRAPTASSLPTSRSARC